MSYTQVINGVTVTSNVPFDQTPPPGALVTLDLKFNSPISYLATLGYDLLTIFNQSTFQSQLVLAGWNGTVTNYSVYSIDAFTQRIAFIIPVTAVAAGYYGTTGPFAAQVALYLFVAVVAIIVGAALASFVVGVLGTIATAVAQAGPYFLAAVGIVAAVGVGAFVYDFLRGGRPFREKVYREVGRTAKGTVKGAVHVAGSAAKAAAGGGLRLVQASGRGRGEDDEGEKVRYVYKEERRPSYIS